MNLTFVPARILGVDRLQHHRAKQREYDEQHDIAEEQDLGENSRSEVGVDNAQHTAREREQKKHESPFQHRALAGKFTAPQMSQL